MVLSAALASGPCGIQVSVGKAGTGEVYMRSDQIVAIKVRDEPRAGVLQRTGAYSAKRMLSGCALKRTPATTLFAHIRTRTTSPAVAQHHVQRAE